MRNTARKLSMKSDTKSGLWIRTGIPFGADEAAKKMDWIDELWRRTGKRGV
jgi:hypothetical protein